jgi:Ca2+-binding EF-hand superfamily protein
MLKNAFRALDKDNSGTLSMTEIRDAFVEMKFPAKELETIFKNVDFNHDAFWDDKEAQKLSHTSVNFCLLKFLFAE